MTEPLPKFTAGTCFLCGKTVEVDKNGRVNISYKRQVSFEHFECVKQIVKDHLENLDASR